MFTRWVIRRLSDGQYLSNYRHALLFGDHKFARLFTRKSHAAPSLRALRDSVELVELQLCVKGGDCHGQEGKTEAETVLI